MELVKLGKKGQVTIPRKVLRQVGVRDEQPLLVSTTDNGGILLRPAGVYPIEIYTDQRIREFEEANEVSASVLDEAEEHVARKHKNPPRQ